jgi:hypothetical protein
MMFMSVFAWVGVGCTPASNPSPGNDNGSSATQEKSTIGPAGGTLALGDDVEVTVPAGALAEEIELGLSLVEVASVAAAPPAVRFASELYAFTPHGTTFSEPISIRIALGSNTTAVAAMRLDDESDTIWEFTGAATVADGFMVLQSTTFSVIAATEPNTSPPPDAGSAGDSGSSDVCGDSEVTGTELCDTAIAAGQTGACPTNSDCETNNTACSFGNVYTPDGQPCQTTCVGVQITNAVNDDGCCPQDGTPSTDNDCTGLPDAGPNPLLDGGSSSDAGPLMDGGCVSTFDCSTTAARCGIFADNCGISHDVVSECPNLTACSNGICTGNVCEGCQAFPSCTEALVATAEECNAAVPDGCGGTLDCANTCPMGEDCLVIEDQFAPGGSYNDCRIPCDTTDQCPTGSPTCLDGSTALEEFWICDHGGCLIGGGMIECFNQSGDPTACIDGICQN